MKEDAELYCDLLNKRRWHNKWYATPHPDHQEGDGEEVNLDDEITHANGLR